VEETPVEFLERFSKESKVEMDKQMAVLKLILNLDRFIHISVASDMPHNSVYIEVSEDLAESIKDLIE
jgi:hypothetical protein